MQQAERLLSQIEEQIPSNLSTVEKGRNFLEWVLYNVFDKVESEIEDSDVENSKGVLICDGCGDKGIDAVFVSNGSMYILQSKYNTSHSDDEVHAFIMKMGNILKKQVDSTSTYFNTIYDLIFDENSFINDIQFFYITERQISTDVFKKEIEDFEESMPEHCGKTCRMKIMGINEIIEYRDAIANAIPQKFIGKKAKLLIENYFENKQRDTIVAEVSLKSIASLVKANKEYLFYSNIRNFLNSTKINKDMVTTFKEKPTLFWHYNNGITIVCEDYKKKNDTVEITTPQIVNGCQTVNVIFTQWDALKKDKEKQNSIQGTILVKIIRDTNDKRKDITRYTNSQNAVTGKDFFALDGFHKTLKKDFENLGYNEPTFNDKTPTDPRFYLFPYGIMYYGRNNMGHKKDNKQRISNLFFVSIYFRLVNRILFCANLFTEDTYDFLQIKKSIEILDKLITNEKVNIQLINLANEILFDHIYDDTGIKEMIGDNLPNFLKNTIEQDKCVNIINEKINNRLTKQNAQQILASIKSIFQQS